MTTSITPPPPLPSHYFLRTTSTPPLYLRLHGDGIHAVVLTPEPPKFLRWEHLPATTRSTDPHSLPTEGREIAHSWKNPERTFGLVMNPPRAKYAWEEVQIVESAADEQFYWEAVESSDEHTTSSSAPTEILKWRGGVKGADGIWAESKGWIVTPWVHGYPQLFWLTGMVDRPLPPFCERVSIVREYLGPRDDDGPVDA